MSRQSVVKWLKVVVAVIVIITVVSLALLVLQAIIVHHMTFPRPVAAFIASLMPMIAQTLKYRIEVNNEDAWTVPALTGSVDFYNGDLDLAYDAHVLQSPFLVVLILAAGQDDATMLNVTYSMSELEWSAPGQRGHARSTDAPPPEFDAFRRALRTEHRVFLTIFPATAKPPYSRLFCKAQARLVPQ